MKILVVDDNTLTRKLLRAILATEGHLVVEAEDGLAALEILERDPSDAVISDILMPRMDGYRLCYEIRKRPNLRAIPFIAYTSTYVSCADEKAALDIGADRFIRKPALPEVIIKALQEVVESTGARHAKQLAEPEELLALREYSEALVRKLEERNIELVEMNDALEERAILAEFDAEVAAVLTHKGTSREILQLCTAAMVRHLQAAFARIWTLNEGDNVLELQASAGMYTHIDGGHARVPVGQFKIGLIASERKPHMTNAVIGDPRVHDQEWAKREGMVAFAGYPLIVEDRLVGVMAMFARKSLSQNILDAMASGAKGIAVGIERKLKEEELRQSEERFRELAENINEVFFVINSDGSALHYVSPAYERLFGRKTGTFYKNPRDWLDAVHPDDRQRVEKAFESHPDNFDHEYRIVHPDGQLHWMHTRTFPVRDEAGTVVRVVGIAEDITERKTAEEEGQQNLDRIRALHEIHKAIVSLELQSILDLLLEKMDLVLPYAATTVRLFNRENGLLEPVACRNLDANEWKAEQWRGGRGLVNVVLANNTPTIIRNAQIDPRVRDAEFYRKHRLVSYLGVPLSAKDEVIGVLGFYTKEEHEFAQEEIEFLTTLAGQAAIAIQNAQLFEDTQRAKAALETTNQYLERSLSQLGSLYSAMTPVAPAASTQALMSGIIERLMDATGSDAALIRIANKEDGTLPIVEHRGFSDDYLKRLEGAPSGGAIEWVFEHDVPIIAPDIATEPRLKGKMQLELGLRSCAILPLKVDGEVCGVLHVASRKLGYYAKEQKNHLVAIARQMSIALENRELFDSLESSRNDLARANAALQESNRMLSALHAIATAASQSLDLEQVLQAAIAKITDIFGFDATQIHIYNERTDELLRSAAFEKDADRFTPANSIRKGEGIVGTVAESGEPMIFEDTETDPRYRQISQTKLSGQFRYHFFAVFPIKSKLRILGTLACTNTETRKLNLGEVQLLEALTDQIAVAIENSDLYKKVLQKVQELEQKTAELEKANRVKDEFLSVISHELRTPINVIMGYASLVKDGVLGEVKPAQDDALKKISAESSDLLAMINSILYATTLEADQVTVDNQEFNPASLLAELRAAYAVTMQKDLRLLWDYPADLPALKSDRRKLKQILDSLIGNAVKFTEQGQVSIGARVCEPGESRNGGNESPGNGMPRPTPVDGQRWLELKVADTGVGIPSKILTQVYDKFYQADSSDTRDYGGVGLGLYIAKKFTEILGGKIEVESVVGKGSTFTVRIPCKS